MRKKIVDIVNFNSDASCLSSKSWLESIAGGNNSYLIKLLNNYINQEKKVTLGIMGSSIADIAVWNPEVLDLINNNRDIFEILLRPFSHDISLLRSHQGFKLNLEYGLKTLEREFGKFLPYYLPPEFMITNYQIKQLLELGVEGTFVNPIRLTKEIQGRIPQKPYLVKGVSGVKMPCFPFSGELTKEYLNSIHNHSSKSWNDIIQNQTSEIIFSWRDGESPMLIPNGIEREKDWLMGESSKIQRVFLGDILGDINFIELVEDEKTLSHYPISSFLAWIKEFRMLGYIQKVQEMEKHIEQFDPNQLGLWFSAINSDILSSVEKSSPKIVLYDKLNGINNDFTIWRSQKGFEGEDFLYLFENIDRIDDLLNRSDDYIIRLKKRIEYINKLALGNFNTKKYHQ